MSDEYLQEGQSLSSLEEVVSAGVGGRQALILSAFLDERRKWEERRTLLQGEFNEKIEAYKKASASVNEEPSWKRFLYHKILRKPSPAAERLNNATQDVDNIAKKILEHDASEPNATRYELAALGNNLFKPR